jgi:hypothetical protein
LGEALRKSGLDEYTAAETMAGLIDNLKTDGQDKLLLDALKESFRVLDNARAERAAAASGASVPVNLVHCVPRPGREQKKRS